MIPNPIHRVLSTLSTRQVQYLLMGGQACVLYGAAEFSRDCDIVILCNAANLERLQSALDDLQATTIAVPPFDVEYLQRGHAVHFRCHAKDVEGVRLDVMSKMRGVAAFDELWARRTTVADEKSRATIELLSLPDLVAAKRTQRDKDWPMIRRLVEAHFARHEQDSTDEQVRFWLCASQTPAMLIQLAARYRKVAENLFGDRPVLVSALNGDVAAVREALAAEQQAERASDEAYWKPLKRELEQLRQRKR